MSVATNTVRTEIAVKRVDYYVRLSQVKTMIDHVFTDSEIEGNFRIAEMSEKTVIDTKEIIAVGAHHRSV